MFTIIDTLEITKRLQNKGAKPELAEEFAEILKDTHSESIKNLATKQDLKDIKKDIKDVRKEVKDIRKEVKDVKKEVKNDIKLVRSEIKIAMLTTIISLSAIITFIEKFIN